MTPELFRDKRYLITDRPNKPKILWRSRGADAAPEYSATRFVPEGNLRRAAARWKVPIGMDCTAADAATESL